VTQVNAGRLRAALAEQRNLIVREQVGAHAAVLGTLTWIEEGDFHDLTSIRTYWRQNGP
jgi:hypothetical protein